MNAIIVGASSGIGAALAVELAAIGYSVGLAARRGVLLEQIASTLPTRCFTKVIDLSDVNDAMEKLRSLCDEMNGVDLIVLSSGVGYDNTNLEWSLESHTIEVNVVGFASMVNIAIQHFTKRGSGHLVGISSIASIRGNGGAPGYGASKAFVSHYLQAMRHRMAKANLPIYFTEIQSGFVDTAMAKGDGLFWIAPVKVAAQQIVHAIRRKAPHAYVTRRWRLIAWALRLMPDWLYHKL